MGKMMIRPTISGNNAVLGESYIILFIFLSLFSFSVQVPTRIIIKYTELLSGEEPFSDEEKLPLIILYTVVST